MTERFTLPGFVDAHSHAFQRALRGRSEGGDFWAWREAMLLEAARQTPETVRRDYAAVYARAAARPATRPWVSSTTSACRRRGRRSRRPRRPGSSSCSCWPRTAAAASPASGRGAPPSSSARSRRCARPASGSASPPTPSAPARPTGSRRSARYAAAEGLPLHVHADEQPREIEECLAEHGVRPIELLARTRLSRARDTTVVHATHADAHELDLLADAGARVCLCPTTEANLGDGYAPVEALLERGIGICIGSDSNVRIDPLEELRELEGIARRSTGRRNVIPVETLLAYGSSEGAAALGLERWPDVSVDLAHPSLAGIEPDDVPGALVFGCSAEVFA